MKNVFIQQTDPFFLQEIPAMPIRLEAEDYLQRIALLRARMAERGLAFLLVYGDREHFSQIEYLSGYDCRFEESILIIPQDGVPTIFVGNEGMAYSAAIPFACERVYYRNFSLQGQPRAQAHTLPELLRNAGVNADQSVGICGVKYFEPGTIPGDPTHTFDLPHYVMQAIFEATDASRVVNATDLLTGLDGGIRLVVRTAKEIAMAEAAACESANAVIRMLKALRPGVSERDLAFQAQTGFAPWSMFPMVNFGAQSIAYGLGSPRHDSVLNDGDVCGVCYGIRGSLTARVGVAAKDQAGMGHGLSDLLDSFYGKFFEAMARWYETLCVGATGHALHWAVHDIIGGPSHNVELNCGHFTGMDEWVNALSFDGSTHTVPDGAYMQADIIASASDPVRCAICEDTVIVAGPTLREALKREYPETHARIVQRQQKLRDVLGIAISDDVLPMSNLNAAMFPFMLDLGHVFALSR